MYSVFKTKEEIMASAAVMVKSETAVIDIDKVKLIFTVDLTSGTKDAVTFHADEDCILHFENPAVFGREYLPLRKDVLQEQPVVSPNQVTRFELFVPLTVVTPPTPMALAATGEITPRFKVWPIVP
jgi:hypothetical protein